MENLNLLDASELSAHDTLVAKLRNRISDLEEENANLRRLDEVIRRNARLFDSVLRHSRDGFFLVTPRLTFLKVIHSVLGNTDENLSGQPVLAIIHPEDRAAIETAFATLLSEPARSVTCKCRAQDQQGHWCWMEVEMTDLLDDPDVQAIVFTNRNITRRRAPGYRTATVTEPRPQPQPNRDRNRTATPSRDRNRNRTATVTEPRPEGSVTRLCS